MTKRFKEVERLLWKKAHSAANTYRVDLEDAFGEVCVIFCEACHQWDEERGQFHTFLYRKIDNEIKNWGHKQIRQTGLSLSKEVSKEEERFRIIEIRDRIKDLSYEARSMLNILANAPMEIMDINLSPRQRRGKVRDFMLANGWKWQAYWKASKELKAFHNEL